MADEAIANLTHHQNITDAILTSMGETMALQQALLQVPSFDGKNMTLKTFLQDVESGLTFVPRGLLEPYFKGVCSKLKDTARDAVSGQTINSMESLTKALKEYFSAKKSYPQYCADIQAVCMRQKESVISYYNRIRTLISNAVTSLKGNFAPAEIASMEKMINGLALESFKRGLPDDLIYGVSVQNPTTLEEAYKIATRLEEDLKGSSERGSNYMRLAQSDDIDNGSRSSPRVVRFEDDERRGSIPFRFDRTDTYRPINNRTDRSYNHPNGNRKNNFGRNHPPFSRRTPSPTNFYPPQGYFPPIPMNPYMPMPYSPFMPGMFSQYTTLITYLIIIIIMHILEMSNQKDIDLIDLYRHKIRMSL